AIDPHQQTIRVKHTTKGPRKEFCDSFVRSMRHQITAHQTFDVVNQGNSSFALELECETERLRGTLTYTAGKADGTTLGVYEIDLRKEGISDPAPLALRMLGLLKDGMPW